MGFISVLFIRYIFYVIFCSVSAVVVLRFGDWLYPFVLCVAALSVSV
jgi:hypothetical protein